jgi:CSLREA domain-containing protein
VPRLALAVLCAVLLGKNARADSFIVTKEADTRDGACDSDCSLREAIIAANANPASDTIDVPAGTYVLTLAGAAEDAAATGDLDITDTSGELRLTGAGADVAIIDANTIDRVFHILPGATVIISGLTVRGGKVSDDADPEAERPSVSGGGILNLGTLTIIDSTLSGNRANDGGGIYSGDGSTVTIQHSTVMDNTVLNDGGGIVNGGNLTITNSTLRENHGCGGGIYTYGTLMITGSTLSGNLADGADCEGGGMFIEEGTVDIANSTLSGNLAGGVGGGIANSGELIITNSTFLRNSSLTAGGGIITDDHTTLLRNTIFASGPAGGNCSSRASGSIIDGGHNLDSGTSCGFSAANGSSGNTNPQLDPAGLKDNGGPTQTIALLAGSPAINAGNGDVCATAPVNGVDQRSYVRSGTGYANCSIGAYEYNSPGPPRSCVGDCNHNSAVAITELVTLVNIALGSDGITACAAGDANGDAAITIDEIIRAARASLSGCPAPVVCGGVTEVPCGTGEVCDLRRG